ncbi:unnamed protein product [Lymnaea stagnalis]|uniref:Chitinase n=1 Tax=Lymnaea stagnalis TaxID=6523 RepID=A0AAV2H2K8_LYMST
MRKFLLLFMIGVVLLKDSLGNENVVCKAPKRKDSHPQYCDKYYLCLPAGPVLRICPNGTLYDEKVQTCLSKSLTNCTTRKISTEIMGKEFGACKRLICGYYGHSIWPESIDPKLCTHIHFLHYGNLNENGLHLLSPAKDQMAKGLVGLKKARPTLKLMVALQPNSKMSYEKLAADKELRDFFLKSAAKVVREMQFDGLVIDWRLPHYKGDLYSGFLKEAMIFLQAEAQASNLSRLLLTHHVGARLYLSLNHYRIATIHPHIDYTVIVASHMFGGWHGNTGHHSLLSEVDNVINVWIAKGHPRDKLVIGIPTFGRSFKLKDVSQTNLGAPAAGHGKLILPGKTLYATATFPQICEFLNTGNATVVRSESAAAPYLYYKDFWMGYEDVDSVFYKTRYFMDKNLGGVYVEGIESDDVTGASCGHGASPLLNSAFAACHL